MYTVSRIYLITFLLSATSVFPMAVQDIKQYGFFETQGKRDAMEDAHYLQCFAPGELIPGRNLSFMAGIFDGHGGRNCADFIQKELPLQIIKELSDFNTVTDQQIIASALSLAFQKTDLMLLAQAKKKKWNDGSCAAIALILDNILYAANVGDSRIVLGHKDGSHKELSQDHKPNLTLEKKRILQAGGYVSYFMNDVPRVYEILAVSRAFGDRRFKMPSVKKYLTRKATDDFVIATPDIKMHTLSSNDAFIIIACDGVWDALSSEQATKIVTKVLQETNNPDAAAKKLGEMALKRGSTDNVSVVVYTLT